MVELKQVIWWLRVVRVTLSATLFVSLFIFATPLMAQNAVTDLLGNPLPPQAVTGSDTPTSGDRTATGSDSDGTSRRASPDGSGARRANRVNGQNANGANRNAAVAASSPAGAGGAGTPTPPLTATTGLIQPVPFATATLPVIPAGPTSPEPSGPLEQSFETFGQFNRDSDLRLRQPGTYDPLGIKVGRFLILSEVSVQTLFTDNALSSGSNRVSDMAGVMRPRIRVRSQWDVHALEADVSSSHSRFRDVKSQNGDSFTARLRGRLDVSRRTNISARARYSMQQEDQSSDDTPSNISELSNDRTYSGTVALNHRFNRLSASLRGTAIFRDFDDVALQDGTTQNNDDRDSTQTKLGLRVLYELSPAFSIFAETEVNRRKLDDKVDDNGLRRSGKGYLVGGGFLAEFGPKLTAEIRLGYTRQKLDDQALVDVKGLIFDANLLWRPTVMTSVVLLARSEVDDTTLSQSAGSLDRTYTARVRHAFRPNINVSGELEYGTEDFAGSNVQDQTLTVTATAEYLLNRNVALTSQYRFVRNTSSDNLGEFDRNELRFGIRLQH